MVGPTPRGPPGRSRALWRPRRGEPKRLPQGRARALGDMPPNSFGGHSPGALAPARARRARSNPRLRAVETQGRVVVPYPSREHASAPPGLHSVPARPGGGALEANPAEVDIRLILPVAYARLKD